MRHVLPSGLSALVDLPVSTGHLSLFYFQKHLFILMGGARTRSLMLDQFTKARDVMTTIWKKFLAALFLHLGARSLCHNNATQVFLGLN